MAFTDARYSQFNHVQGNMIVQNSDINTERCMLFLLKQTPWSQQFMLVFSDFDKLNPNIEMRARPFEKCMAGTRDDIFAQVDNWVDDFGTRRNILWIKGSPGAGKSTVAFTLKSRY